MASVPAANFSAHTEALHSELTVGHVLNDALLMANHKNEVGSVMSMQTWKYIVAPERPSEDPPSCPSIDYLPNGSFHQAQEPRPPRQLARPSSEVPIDLKAMASRRKNGRLDLLSDAIQTAIQRCEASAAELRAERETGYALRTQLGAVQQQNLQFMQQVAEVAQRSSSYLMQDNSYLITAQQGQQHAQYYPVAAPAGVSEAQQS